MLMKSKRALRRHHLNRMKQLALEQAKALFPSQRDLWVPQMISRYRNRSPCSCWMCGNPRRYACRIAEQITRQEHIAALREAEQIQDAIGRSVYVARSAGGDGAGAFRGRGSGSGRSTRGRGRGPSPP